MSSLIVLLIRRERIASALLPCRTENLVTGEPSFPHHDVLFPPCLQSKGDEVVHLLQYLCSNDVNVPVGNILHTGMQNRHGGYENDCSLARIAPNQ